MHTLAQWWPGFSAGKPGRASLTPASAALLVVFSRRPQTGLPRLAEQLRRGGLGD